MPIGYDPKETHPVSLKSFDGDKPEAERAKFTCRFFSSRELIEHRKALNSAGTLWNDSKEEDAVAMLDAAFLAGVSGWSGVKDSDGLDVPFSAYALAELPFIKKWRMASEYPAALELSPHEKKS